MPSLRVGRIDFVRIPYSQIVTVIASASGQFSLMTATEEWVFDEVSDQPDPTSMLDLLTEQLGAFEQANVVVP